MALAFFIQTSAIGAQAFLIREYRGVGTALLGNLSMALGFFLSLFRGVLPDLATIVVGNTLILLGPTLFYVAISRFTNQAYSRKFAFFIVGIAMGCLVYFRYVTDNIAARIICVSLCGAINAMLISYKLWMARNTAYRFSVWLTLIPFAAYGIFLFVRVAAAIISPPDKLYSNTPVEIATYFLLFLISFLWTIGFVLMVSQRLQADLRELATIDSLTHISNRRATQTFLEKELSRAQRQKSQFSVLLIDIDNFKQINDQNGHAMGDRVLVKSAELFQKSIRKQDLVGRWGGEEFLIILSGAKLDDAKCLAERLRSQVEETQYPMVKSPTTISIGLASSQGNESIDQILKHADDALYVAKATKNAVVTAHEGN